MKDEPMDFIIEDRSGIAVLRWEDGSCRPATEEEVALWSRLKVLEEVVAAVKSLVYRTEFIAQDEIYQVGSRVLRDASHER